VPGNAGIARTPSGRLTSIDAPTRGGRHPSSTEGVPAHADIVMKQARNTPAEAEAPAVRVPQALLSLLERTTNDLITLPSAALDDLIDRTLADIGQLFGADRAYLFLASDDGTVFDNTHEWCAPGVEPQRENLQGLPIGLVPWWSAEMFAGRDIVLGSLDELPPEAESERALLEPQGIQSLLALPMRWRGRFWGLAGFDHVVRRRQWLADEMAVLRLVVSAFAQGFERRRLDARLGLASTVFHHAQEGIFVTDGEHRILDVNPTFTEITGCRADAAIGRLQQDVLPHSDSAEIWRAVAAVGLWRGEIDHERAGGQSCCLRITVSAVRDERGERSGFVGVFSDITLLREQEKQLRQLAYHDPLTQLPNRVLLADRIRQALARSRRSGELLAVCFLDLDGFKGINDTHGHGAGDDRCWSSASPDGSARDARQRHRGARSAATSSCWCCPGSPRKATSTCCCSGHWPRSRRLSS
jgi:PAS domain S-box-containing protein